MRTSRVLGTLVGISRPGATQRSMGSFPISNLSLFHQGVEGDTGRCYRCGVGNGHGATRGCHGHLRDPNVLHMGPLEPVSYQAFVNTLHRKRQNFLNFEIPIQKECYVMSTI